MMRPDEKYLILTNGNQFYAIFRCDQQTMRDYIAYGNKYMLNADGSLNLDRLSEWLTNRRVFHRVQFQKERNPILKWLLRHEIRRMNKNATDHGLFVSDKELGSFLDKVKSGRRDLCWNLAGTP